MLCTEAINNKQTNKIVRMMASSWQPPMKSQKIDTTVIMVVSSYKNAVTMSFLFFVKLDKVPFVGI